MCQVGVDEERRNLGTNDTLYKEELAFVKTINAFHFFLTTLVYAYMLTSKREEKLSWNLEF